MTRRLSQLSRVSSMAIAVVLTAGAAAQSFQGSSSISSGDVFVSTGVGTTDVMVNSSTAVIDWTPTDNAPGTSPINFQPAGTTATFSGFGPFAVLNRIDVADANRVISLNGTIQGDVGGAIFFYSPSGFVVGSTAVINVGSLVLSASPLTVDGNGEFLIGSVAQFNAANPNASITTLAGSQISANGAGSYVALVAPRIVHQGTIRTDTAAALVAAEAATISFSPDGLFNIEVTTGTDAATGIHVDGGTIARNSAVEGSNHHAYLVAVAKNDAVTMLINNGASIGFETATSATVEGNSVVLSGGYDVQGGAPWTAAGTSQVDLSATNATFSSDVDAQISGNVSISSAGGALSFGRDLTVYGGEATTVGGNILIDAANGNALTIGGDLYARAFRRNADGSETGLITRLGATGGSTATIGGSVWLNSDSYGAPAQDNGLNGGNATGGNAQINIGNNSTLTVGGNVSVSADGYGGEQYYGDGSGGNGTGGTALVMSITGNANVDIAGSTYVSAQGYGGSAGECSVCNVVGGNGTGGNASVHTNVGSGNQMTLGNVVVNASGYGGAGDAQAGQGIGGTAALSAGDNSSLTVTGDAIVEAGGFGGFGFGNNGGLGRGGSARIDVYNGGAIDIAADVLVGAEGIGASNYGEGFSGSGGTGEGGFAQIYAGVGSIDIGGLAEVVAAGLGGDAFGATGGNAFGGTARVGTDGGTIQFSNDLLLDASATGGEGAVGGNATARVSPPTDELSPIAVALYTGAGGSLTVSGTALLDGSAQGGNGFDGNGGNANGGEADVVAYVGNIDVGNLIVAVDATGGGGGNGGAGGNALGGVVDAVFGFGAAAIGGTLTIGSAVIVADGIGGEGGAGSGGNSGGNGGAGGNGTGGNIIYVGSAAGGTLDSGAALISARGEGGAGGAGGDGDGGTGGHGGAGGVGRGGFIQTGSISADQAPGVGGGAFYTTLLQDVSGIGGVGGNGGTGGGGDGAGGNGGDAFGGRSLFLSRGVLVTADAVQLIADATGGDGGFGSTDGDGGDGTTGVILVESKDRFGHPTQRGTLNVGTIDGSAVAIGGIGATDGTGTATGGSYFRLLNGDATIGSINITVSGDLYNGTLGPSYVSVRDGLVTVGDFSFTTSGDLGLDGNNGTMDANSITLSAGNFLAFPPAPSPPIVAATYSAGSFDISTGGDFVTNANLDSGSGLAISAPGSIIMADADAQGSIDLAALGGSLTAGTVTAGGHADLFAADSIATGSIQSGSFLTLDAMNGISTGALSAAGDISGFSGGPISIGNASSLGGSIFLDSGGALATGNLDALFGIELSAVGAIGFGDTDSDYLDFDSGGAVTGGDIIAGTYATGEAQGAVSLGNVNVGILRSGGITDDGFAAGFASATSVSVGNVAVDEAIGFATFGTLTTGNLSAGTGVMALVQGNMSFGSITTAPNGQVYLADAQMFLDAGGPDNFDATMVLNSPPIATSGSISIGGPVSTGALAAAAGTSFSAQALNAPFFVDVSAGGLLTVGGVWNVGDAYLTSGDIAINAAINAAEVGLVSTNGTRTVIGDGTGLSGYNLSNAEYNLISADDINVTADSALGAAPTMIIGDLNVAIPGSSEGVEYDFTTWNSQTETGEGSIRIVGDMLFTGMGEFDVIDFTTGRFELDAETGTLALTGAGNALAGTVEIYASNIHIASGAILDQLAVDPQYAGYRDDLNAPAAVERPDGVLRAGSVAIEFGNVEPGELYTLYVQNSGTQARPAGFLVSESVLFSEGSEQGFAPGSIDVVINGQIETSNGTLTGADVRDALVEAEGDLTPFTATSTVNGCLLTGPCTLAGPIPPGFLPTPGIQDEIRLVENNQMPPPEFGNEDFIDDNDEDTEDSQTSPIVPPAPLFDTSEMETADGTVTPEIGTSMRSSPGIKREGDVDDPVSGTGNPALMESAPPPSYQQETQQ
ncbi:beta strand repeat-containing protein [Sphingomonas xanthus]|uniref:Uncharacterized protein n=1 Tax=Sphingomonas xanthus TaxID=2594473 RepID=A0A516IRZ1_9SPHN|nr:hypothetical protein [Sphingomonas xanthus]QDP19651.1 hypothetical protein FMM02_06585 [Sphingomonas xanthus]